MKIFFFAFYRFKEAKSAQKALPNVGPVGITYANLGWCEHPLAAAFFVFVYILMQNQSFVNMKSRIIAQDAVIDRRDKQ